MNPTKMMSAKQPSLSLESSDLAQSLDYHITATGDASEEMPYIVYTEQGAGTSESNGNATDEATTKTWTYEHKFKKVTKFE